MEDVSEEPWVSLETLFVSLSLFYEIGRKCPANSKEHLNWLELEHLQNMLFGKTQRNKKIINIIKENY